MNYLDIFLQTVADAGIYAVLLVLGFVMFYIMHKTDISRLDAMMERSIKAIERSYKNANDILNRHIEKYTKEHISKN